MKETHKTVCFIKPKTLNSYYQKNPKYFDDLIKLVQEHPSKYSLILNKHGRKREPNIIPEYKYLNDWINEVTNNKLGNNFYKTSTKCYWIINDLVDFPVCSVCGLRDNYINKNVSLWTGYHTTCSNKCAQNSEACKMNRILTCRERYGCDNTYQSEEKKNIAKQTKLERYGDSYFTNPKKISETKQKHAENDPEYNKKILNKREATMIEKFGVRNAAMSEEILKKSHKKYMFDNLLFDSSVELAYYIWARDHNKQIFRTTKKFIFIYKNKEHCYFPDFYNKELNQYVEIKGDQFFNKDGVLYVPWKGNMKDDEYADLCAKTLEKYNCMIKNNVIILKQSSIEVQTAIQYINDTYGSNYLATFRYKNNKVNI